MTIHRFFIPKFQRENSIFLPKEISWQISKVLRLQKGTPIVVFDGENNEFTYIISEITKDSVNAVFQKHTINNSEPKTEIVLCQALLPRDTFEQVLQKATQIGVWAFVPIATSRTLVKVKDIQEHKKERWQKIIQEASEQSERGIVPIIAEAVTFEKAIDQALEDSEVFIAWEDENNNFPSKILKEILPNHRKRIAIFIGPEGGFTQDEIAYAVEKGVQTISLGPRILKSETAGIVLASLILFTLGELDKR